MARSVMRRAVSKVFVGTLAVAALGVGQALLGGGVASADPMSQTVTTSNISATKTVDNPNPFPGDTVTTTVTFSASGSRYMQNFTDFPPADYVLQSVSGKVWRSGPVAGGFGKGGTFDGTPAQDPVSGAVRLSWTASGNCIGAACKLALLDKGATLTFTYKVAANAQPGPRTTGMEFNIYSFNDTQRWNPLSGLNLSVQQASTATSATVTVPPSAKTGDSVQLSASVSPANATGTVQFKDGITNIGSPIPVVNGIASTSHTFATAGSKPITATFAGSGGFSNSTSPGRIVEVSVRGQDDVESSTIMTAPQTATVGVAVRLSAQVSSTALTLPGTVQFYDGGTPIGPRLPVGNGVVALDYVFDVSGAHQISAAYTGGAGVDGSASVAQTVQVADAPTPPGGAGSLGSLGNGSSMFGS
ncbi:putative repeat protein (TIGR01451 family) [Rhodococcus sp. OK519]|uniref:Ig-like domain repeat protein n=1 Tax=Rhodococcus sp. OK519 TaxID=2135729 RepID=UPI000D3916C2|nr:putative repeat protein (TIGR01451 family) [Rhodococcus sp. OK519]